MAKKKPPTKAERDHMSRVALLGCIACNKIGYEDTPAEIHHTRFNSGAGQRSSHYDVLPLCGVHHRTGGLGVAFHAGQETWENTFGKEQDLLEEVKQSLGINT